jgi:hypothetical protein
MLKYDAIKRDREGIDTEVRFTNGFLDPSVRKFN